MCWGTRATLCAILYLEDCYFEGIPLLENMFLYLILVLTFCFLETDKFATGCSILISGLSVS